MDPFEMLGVARDATVQQVEARWRELAWALHPDQHPGADEAERARLTTAMAELNEARRVVLATLQRPAVPASLSSPTGATAGPTAGSARPATPQSRPPEPPPPGAMTFVVGTVVGVLLLLVLVVVVVVVATSDDRPAASTASSTTAETVAPTGPPTTLFVEWAIGSCISTGELVVPVDCGAPNAGRIVLRSTAPEFCPDWAEAYVQVGSDVWCVDEDN